MRESNELKDTIHLLQEKHESVSLEFKESAEELPNSFWETYSAFANTHGGYVLLGVSENKKHTVLGVNNPHKIKQDLFSLANNKNKVSHNVINNDDVNEHTINGKIIISIYIPELSFRQKPLYLNNNILNAYVRRNDGDFHCSQEDIRRFIRDSQEDLDSELLDNYTIEDLNEESILMLKNILNVREPNEKFMEMNNEAFLSHIGVLRMDRNNQRKRKLTLAGLLFLGKSEAITDRIPFFHLDYINKSGRGTSRWKDRVSTGDTDYPDLNLFEYYRIVREKLRLTVEEEFELDEKSVRKPPSELNGALREALANMLLHADYFDPETPIKVTVEDLYYEFTNPGMMKISEAQFFNGGVSQPRNHTLFQYFRRMGESEHAGTGGRKIITVAARNKYRLPELTLDTKSTKLRIWRAMPIETHAELSPYARQVLAFLDKKTDVKKADIIEQLGVSNYYAKKALKELMEKNLILSTGKGRATKYNWAPSMVELLDMANQLPNMILKGSKKQSERSISNAKDERQQY